MGPEFMSQGGTTHMETLLQQLWPHVWKGKSCHRLLRKVMEQLQVPEIDLRVRVCLQAWTGQASAKVRFLRRRPQTLLFAPDAVCAGFFLVALEKRN